MWANYYFNQNQLVKIRLKNGIENKDDFNNFIDKWRDLYKEKNNFTFIFDTINTSIINPYYCYLMANFIKELKQNEIQYLNYSIIIVKNYAIKILLNIIFALQKPVAPVFLIDNNNENKQVINNILLASNNSELKTILENNKKHFSIINI